MYNLYIIFQLFAFSNCLLQTGLTVGNFHDNIILLQKEDANKVYLPHTKCNGIYCSKFVYQHEETATEMNCRRLTVIYRSFNLSICQGFNMFKPQYVEASICRYVKASICSNLSMPKLQYVGRSRLQYVETSVCRSLNYSS